MLVPKNSGTLPCSKDQKEEPITEPNLEEKKELIPQPLSEEELKGQNFCSKIESFYSYTKGTPYVWGGIGFKNKGFDCSGFIYATRKFVNSPIPRTTSQKYFLTNKNKEQHWNQADCFDLIWFTFSGDRPYGHIGRIAKENTFWHSGSSKGVNQEKLIKNKFWDQKFVTSKKFF